ncbi:Protein of unknown function [Gryllus bimaculatus]|nr:Protein of unknown function [Gryllus bimaculatus]
MLGLFQVHQECSVSLTQARLTAAAEQQERRLNVPNEEETRLVLTPDGDAMNCAVQPRISKETLGPAPGAVISAERGVVFMTRVLSFSVVV